MVPDENAGLLRFGSAAKPALVPISSGVSSIHSAVAWVDGYGTVVENDSFLVTSWMVMSHTSESLTTSAIEACMWSPGETVMLLIEIEGAGTSSHHAE